MREIVAHVRATMRFFVIKLRRRAKREHIRQSDPEPGPDSDHIPVKIIHLVPFLLHSGRVVGARSALALLFRAAL